MTGGRSYLDRTEDEQEALVQPVTPKATGAVDLSSVKPTPAQRPSPADHEAAINIGRERGFDRSVTATATPRPQPRATAPATGRGPPRRGGPESGRGGEGAKRIIVARGTEVQLGQTGQVAISADAVMLKAFVDRAYYERKTRGELLADMLALWESRHGTVPDEFTR